MDFGDILGAWDQEQKSAARGNSRSSGPQVSHKKANAPTAEEKAAAAQGYSLEREEKAQNEQRINPMELWLRRYGTVDKDAVADEYREQHRMESPEVLREMRPDARIDLHGLTRDEAWEKLDVFVGDCVRRGNRKILIVHGKGNHSSGSDSILGPMVRQFVEQDHRLGTSGHPPRAQGGTGATWAIITE